MWRVFLVVSAAWGWGGAAGESFLSDISQNLRSEIAGVMEMANVTYSKPNINTTYNSSVQFDMRAMGSLYNSTHLVIDFIANKQAYPEGIVSVSDGHLEIGSPREHWRELLAHYAGPTAVIVLAALFVVSLLLAGLLWCCCNWCKSGRRRRAFDRKYDSCLKGMLAILLIALLTLFLFGVVCAFATDAQLETSASEAPEAVRTGLRDARAFLNATQAHARHLLVDNFRELEIKVNGLLTSSGLAVSVQLGAVARGAAVSALAQLVARLDDVQAGLRDVSRLTASLRTRADHLNTGLRKVKRQLLQTLAQCQQPPCKRLQEKYKIGELGTEIQYNQMLDKYFPTMPDVSELLDNVTDLLDSNIKGEVAEGQRVFREIQRAVQREVDRHVPALQAATHDTGRRLAKVADEITALSDSASEQLKQREDIADNMKHFYEQHGPLRRYTGLFAATALLLITCTLALGLTCGVCGKRPDVYGASDCCNKAAGASCLMCGTGCMFVLGALAATVALVYFVVGIASQRFLCDPLAEPRGNRLLEDVDRFVELERALFNERTDPAFNISAVLQRCYQNYTIYETLQLWRLYDVEKLVSEARQSVRDQTTQLRASWSVGTVTILKPSAREKLRQLADAGLSDFDFDRIIDALEANMTSLSLESLVGQLDSTAAAVESKSGYSQVVPELRRAAATLRELHTDTVLPLMKDTDDLQKIAVSLRDSLRFNQSSLREAVAYLTYETEQAERFLNKQGPALVHNITLEFASVISSLVDGYVEVVRRGAREEVGRCGPLARAANATRDAYCHKILMPVNGYWLSVSWCVILLVPLMVVAQRLARLYRHVDPYPGPLVEAEYLYDAYADRDNVPLANAYKAEKRSGRSRSRGGGGAPGGGGEVGAGGAGAPPGPALAPPLDAHHARRYNDMAPKHWEEGPPRYHGPTEYERPPPYYYPGPNDRQ